MNSEAKTFYKSLTHVVGPMALQNLISAAVNSVDVFMLGYVGQTAIAATSLANNVAFILFMVFILRPLFRKKTDKTVRFSYLCYLLVSFTNPLLFSSTAYLLYIWFYLKDYRNESDAVLPLKNKLSLKYHS